MTDSQKNTPVSFQYMLRRYNENEQEEISYNINFMGEESK